MTLRERTALLLTAAGGVQLVGAAYGFGGWRAAAGTSGALMLTLGVLLGLDEDRPTNETTAE